jgi:hypothetical protein
MDELDVWSSCSRTEPCRRGRFDEEEDDEGAGVMLTGKQPASGGLYLVLCRCLPGRSDCAYAYIHNAYGFWRLITVEVGVEAQ